MKEEGKGGEICLEINASRWEEGNGEVGRRVKYKCGSKRMRQ